MARSGLDFADLELRAVELLGRSPAVAELWRGHFKHVMVDEFQDTNRVQLELVEALRGPATRVFTVGDEYQSIYRFRNADLEVFRAERRAAEEAATTDVIDLRGNFRSRPPILAAANAVGNVLLPGFAQLTAGRPAEAADPQVELLLSLNEGRGAKHRRWADRADALRMPPSESIAATVAQARALAERLRQLVDAGDAKPGDIVVLLRAFTHVDAYDDALRRFGLEPYVVGGRGYWSQQQVEDLLRLLGVIANPLDDEMVFGALACPANEVTPDALWLLRMAAGERRHVWPAIERGFGDANGDFELADARQARADRRRGRGPAAPLLRADRGVARGGGADPAGRTGRAGDERLRLRPRAARPKPGEGPDGECAQADEAGRGVRAERGPRFAQLPPAGRRGDQARRTRGLGAGSGRGLRRRADHDRARRERPRVPGGRGSGAGPRPGCRPPLGRHLDRPPRSRGPAGALRPAPCVPDRRVVRRVGADRARQGGARGRGRGIVPPDLRRHDPRPGAADPERRLQAGRPRATRGEDGRHRDPAPPPSPRRPRLVGWRGDHRAPRPPARLGRHPRPAPGEAQHLDLRARCRAGGGPGGRAGAGRPGGRRRRATGSADPGPRALGGPAGPPLLLGPGRVQALRVPLLR